MTSESKIIAAPVIEKKISGSLRVEYDLFDGANVCRFNFPSKFSYEDILPFVTFLRDEVVKAVIAKEQSEKKAEVKAEVVEEVKPK